MGNIRCVAGAAILLIWLFLVTLPGSAQDNKVLLSSPYYPLQVGTTWHYQDGKEKMVVRVAAHEKVGAELCARLEATEKGVTKIEYVAVRADGIYRVKLKDKLLTPPLCFFKLPPKKEETWKVDTDVGGLKIKGSFSVAEEELTVPAGKFKTIRASCKDLVIGTRAMSLTYWFAEKVGIVKQQLKLADLDVELELEKFEPAP